MIDIKNKIVDTLQTALPGVYVTSSYVIGSKELPCLMVSYRYGGDFTETFDNQLAPHHARIVVQLDALATDVGVAESTMATAVDTMHNMKFTCTESMEMSGYRQGITRLTARFTAIVQEGVTTTETVTVDGEQVTTTTTTYQIYRR